MQSRPPYQRGKSTYFGFPMTYSHPQSFTGLIKQIFPTHVYDFVASRPDPLIIDAGANIGLATVYWKQRFPEARIIAFEADPEIVTILEQNVAAARYTDVEVVSKAVWVREEVLTFASEGGDAGRLGEGSTKVQAIRLADYLTEEIDLLKMDIEGAEVDVILDCSNKLKLVSNIAVEYHSIVGRPQRLGKMLTCLENAGFRLFVRAEYSPTVPMRTVASEFGMDMRLNIWGVRES